MTPLLRGKNPGLSENIIETLAPFYFNTFPFFLASLKIRNYFPCSKKNSLSSWYSLVVVKYDWVLLSFHPLRTHYYQLNECIYLSQTPTRSAIHFQVLVQGLYYANVSDANTDLNLSKNTI